jgi:hypothetical protein
VAQILLPLNSIVPDSKTILNLGCRFAPILDSAEEELATYVKFLRQSICEGDGKSGLVTR